ncbi:hypothetical protein [Photobacterium nomapromontoriensis]|uniref:hypothetical protein n=1 Tax=Photobacterium nomapromontoriensis TaxID=2910237 RepID=UPI003D106252
MSDTVLTKEKFHEILHTDIKKPISESRKLRIPAGNSTTYINTHTGAHKIEWTESTIFLTNKVININVYLNFKKNSLSQSEYNKLVSLAKEGIEQYWSRNIKLGTARFSVRVKAHHRDNRAIPVDLYIEMERGKYARSMNPAVLGVDASFIYNKGTMTHKNAEMDFKLTTAHEFGHSVLMYAGGVKLSWGHKGTSDIFIQRANNKATEYPNNGDIDLMKYYKFDDSENRFEIVHRDSIVTEVDLKRLIWGADIKWVNQ